jgi:release factor glutamine methyltransferase
LLNSSNETSTITIDYALKWARQQLQNIASNNLDCLLLMQKATGFSKEQVVFNAQTLLSQEQIKSFCDFVLLRQQNKPIAHILGYKQFFGNDFIVNEHTLIPRPDSETIIEAVIKNYHKNTNFTALDLCCGSGCLAISLLKHFNNAKFIACDISEQAIKIAQQNAINNQVENRFLAIQSNLFSNLSNYKFDLIISNPPYIASQQIVDLSSEVKDFEPIIALDGGEDGLHFYRQIALLAPNFYSSLSNSKLFVEVGFNQHHQVTEIFTQHNWIFNNTYRDLAQIDRVLNFSL